MSALARIFDRVREQLAELGEAVIGNLAQRELDDEIRATDTQLRELRAALASLQAGRLTAQERLDAATASILHREAQALAALEADKPDLAREVAAAIVQLERTREDEQAFLLQLEGQIAQMRLLVEQGEHSLRRLQHQLDVMRAAETVHRAQETIGGRHDGAASLPQTAIQSLLRARRRQPSSARVDEAHVPAADSDLDARLQAAGIDDGNARAQLVLDRIGQRLSETARPAGRRGRSSPSTRSSR